MQSVLEGTQLPPKPDVLEHEPVQVPPKKRRGWLIAAVVVGLVGLGAGMGAIAAQSNSQPAPSAPIVSDVAPEAPVTQPVEDQGNSLAEPEVVDVPGATIETAIPVGNALEGSGWAVKVIGFDEDATSQIMAENMFNEGPKHGKFAMVEFRVTRTGTGSGDPFYDLWPSLIVRGESFEAVSEVLPNDMIDRGNVPPSTSATGTFAFDIPRSGTETSVIYLEIDGQGPSAEGFLQVP